MASRPAAPRVIVFIDGQNLFKQAQRCFGDHDVPYENYDPVLLARTLVANIPDGVLTSVRFFSGRPWAWEGSAGEADLGNLLNSKMAHHGSVAGGLFVPVIKNLAYRSGGKPGDRPIGREKGVDVALAIHVVTAAFNDEMDVGIILSQDKDLTDVPTSVARVRERAGRWIHLECAFPVPDEGMDPERQINRNGISKMRWRRIDRTTYLGCLDQKDFRYRYKTGDSVAFPGNFEVVAHVRTTKCQVPLKERRPFGSRDTFPACRSCRAPVFWARYTVFRHEP